MYVCICYIGWSEKGEGQELPTGNNRISFSMENFKNSTFFTLSLGSKLSIIDLFSLSSLLSNNSVRNDNIKKRGIRRRREKNCRKRNKREIRLK